MVAHVVVTDTGLQRYQIKVVPETHMSDVRNQACTRSKFDPSNYGLKHNNKPVDLSRTFRQSGLSSGAKLELVVASKSPSVVAVALQLPDGTRHTDKFPSNTTLWLILRKFEASDTKNLNFTARSVADTAARSSGKIFYEMPVLNVMNREFGTFVDLQKTLAQIGISSGSILLRLSYRQTETPLEVATTEIGQYFKEVEEVAQNTGAKSATASAETPAPTADGTITDQIAKVQEPDAQTPSSQTSSSVSLPAPAETSTSDEGIAGPGQRMISVFSAPTSTVPRAAQQEFNDSDYEPSVADAKLHQSRLLNRTQNKRLLSDAEQEALQREREAKKSSVVETRVKVRFPDQTTVQFPVNATETGEKMLEFVRGLIVAGDQPFSLIYKDSKGQIHNVPESSTVRLIKDLGFEGPTLVTFTWKDEASEAARKWPILQQKYATQAKPVQVPEIPKAQEVGSSSAPKPKEEKKAGSGKSTEDKLKGFLKGLSKK
ncbi:hypothetical protein V496_08869 [Pseudogymnoascus sp. VKM F-4515 (FW-2607)]|nr:hypothetical protein V496_08869 [Pseudogymnoascus sp. VKM F-4515 (FW-2607)]